MIASLVTDPSKLGEALLAILQTSFDFALTILQLTIGGHHG